MFTKILSILATFIIYVISSLGYAGIFIAMAIESACIPLPSEIIMPFSGYLVYKGEFSLFWVSMYGALGCVAGSIIAYYAGIVGGRPFAFKYGKYLLISNKDILMAEEWFEKYGEAAIFFSRLLPVIRTFISLPAGIAGMEIKRFIIYSFIGSLPWCYALAYIGQKLGENWNTLGTYFHKFDIAIGILIIGAGIWWVRRHFKKTDE